jgi:hypothetical protein
MLTAHYLPSGRARPGETPSMQLVPNERAVLKIICMLVVEASKTTHRVTLLRSRWPVLHFEAYSGGYESLMA